MNDIIPARVQEGKALTVAPSSLATSRFEWKRLRTRARSYRQAALYRIRVSSAEKKASSSNSSRGCRSAVSRVRSSSPMAVTTLCSPLVVKYEINVLLTHPSALRRIPKLLRAFQNLSQLSFDRDREAPAHSAPKHPAEGQFTRSHKVFTPTTRRPLSRSSPATRNA